MSTSNGVEIADCEDCPPQFDISSLGELFQTDREIQLAILAELIMIRKTMTETMDGLAAIGSSGFGSLLSGLFRPKE